MALAFKTQLDGSGGGKELLHKIDNFLVSVLGYSREYYSGGVWPTSYTAIPYNAIVGWRNPSSGKCRFEVAAAVSQVASHATGTITVPAFGSIADGDTFTIAGHTYELDTDGAGNFPGGGGTDTTIQIDISMAASSADVREALIAGITLGATASYQDANTVKLTAVANGAAGNVAVTRSNAAFTVTGLSGGNDTYMTRLSFAVSPVVNLLQGIAVGVGANFGTNPYITAGLHYVLPTSFRYTLRGDADHVFGWTEFLPPDASYKQDNGFYLGRVENARETAAVDPFPVVGWVGHLNASVSEKSANTGIYAPWRKIYAADQSTALNSGALYVPRHPTTGTKDIDYPGNGQTTLSTANWQWLTPLIGFNEGGKREYPGNPVALFVTADDATKSLWGENGEWAKVNGVIMAWESGVTIKSSYP